MNLRYMPEINIFSAFDYTFMQDNNQGVVNLQATLQSELTTESWSNTFGKDVLAQNWLHIRPDRGLGNETPVTNLSDPFTSVSLYADGLLKSVRALILTDLGQSATSNVFANPRKIVDFINATLQFHQNTLPVANETLYWTPIPNINDTEPLFHPTSADPAAFYEWTNTGVPDVQPAYISTQYLCNVPKMKPTAALVFSVILADIVFLQALWTLLNWAVTTHLQRVDAAAMYCSGCANTIQAAKPEGSNKGGHTVVTMSCEETNPDEGSNQIRALKHGVS